MEARFNTRIKECQSDEELYSYLLECIPIIREYTQEAETIEQTSNIMGLKVASRKGVQRKDIYNKYMSTIENQTMEPQIKMEYEHQPCKGCGKKYQAIHDDTTSEDVCTNCGYSEYILGEELGFKEEQEMDKNVVYSYKRDNHFNEWISQFQAKESTSVPDEVITQLQNEFKKQKIKDLSEITHEKVKALLKKLDKSKYYEHVPYITTMLNGIKPPTMTQALEDKLRIMFYKIQKPFEKHKPAKRKNFLSYSYTLYKLCELLGEDDYLPCFPLLKSKEKLYAQDAMWQKICQELKWEYIKTT